MCYNRNNDEYVYKDDEKNKFYYYPEWSWGTENKEWYLWNDLHGPYLT